MKQAFTLLCVCAMFGLNAQPFFQDFESGIAPMTLYDVDGLTPNANVSAYSNAWNAVIPTFGNGTRVAVSTSWYNPVGVSNDWMVTPLVSLPDTNVILRWESKAQDASYRDRLMVYISTTGNTPADFTTVLYDAGAEGEPATWTTHLIDLQDYAGQDVYVAFRNNSNDKFLLVVDNIFVGQQQERDALIGRVNGNINFGTTLEGMRSLEVTVQNLGIEPITELVSTWNFNGETGTDHKTGLNIATWASYTFTHAVPVDYVLGSDYELVLTIDSVNADLDQFPVNNTYSSPTFKVLPPVPNVVGTSAEGDPVDLYESLAAGKAVVFDFFASWCVPCEVSTPALNSLYVANGSGDEDFDVLGISIEFNDTDAIVNGLNWGATYPSLSYSVSGYESYVHYNSNHGLGQSAIPFFVMVCPNLDDLGHSEIVETYIGATDIVNVFNNTWQTAKDECVESLVAVEDLTDIESYVVYPNPASEFLNVNLTLKNTAEIAFDIVDLAGRSVTAISTRTYAAGENIERIDVQDLAPGTYFMHLRNDQGVKTIKFSKVD